ncbi:MAG: hypothetical protein GY703_14330 [Gammaproteobacteria bacterium]|nr:hypothetical protein [Gammaproteobacteria bacterium]
MTDRDEYIQNLKATLDNWNKDIEQLEARARTAQGEVREQFDKQLETLREMRDEALKRQHEMQNAAVGAWDAMVQGTENAWQAWSDAFDDARSKFNPKG